jgi:hypothetical protein
MAGKNLELALLLKLNDQMSKGLKAVMQGVEKESRSAGKSLSSIAAEVNKIRPTGIDRLHASLKQVHNTAKSTLSTLAQIGRTGAQVGSAVMAGGYMAKSAAERPMTYDRRLALLSNTANSDLDATGRIAAKENLNAGIKNAVNAGGGTPEQAADALNTLVGSGAFGNANQAVSLLPMVQKYSTGSGASGNDLAQILVAAKQTMGIADKDMPAMLSKAIKAGQAGGFELTDMAKWLPQQMALAATNGMKGMSGFESLLAANQISRIGAGTSDEAGNNLVNLLAKINSQDTATDFKKQGIDLSGSLAAARGKGMNTLEAFVALVEKIGSQDKNYTNLRKKADTETGADKKATLSAMADILQQKSIGKAVQDRQALMQLLMFIQQRDKYDEVKGITAKETGKEGDTSYQVVANTLDAKTEQMGNKKAFAAIDTLASIDSPLGKLLDKLNAEAEAHPILTTAIYSTATALGVLAAAAGAAGLTGMLTGGKGGALEKAAKVAVGGETLTKAVSVAKGISYAGEIPMAAEAAGGATAAGGIGLTGLAGMAAAGTGLFAMIRHAMEPDKTSMRMPDKNAGIGRRVADYWNVAPEKQADKPVKVQVVVDVKNGNIVAEVNKANSQQARRN